MFVLLLSPLSLFSGDRTRARLSEENEGNDKIEGGLLLHLVTTFHSSLHVSVFFSLGFFLAMWGKGPPLTPPLHSWRPLEKKACEILWKEAAQDHAQNRTHRLHRVCLVKDGRSLSFISPLFLSILSLALPPFFLSPCSLSSFLRSRFSRVHSMTLSSSVPFVIK